MTKGSNFEPNLYLFLIGSFRESTKEPEISDSVRKTAGGRKHDIFDSEDTLLHTLRQAAQIDTYIEYSYLGTHSTCVVNLSRETLD